MSKHLLCFRFLHIVINGRREHTNKHSKPKYSVCQYSPTVSCSRCFRYKNIRAHHCHQHSKCMGKIVCFFLSFGVELQVCHKLYFRDFCYYQTICSLPPYMHPQFPLSFSASTSLFLSLYLQGSESVFLLHSLLVAIEIPLLAIAVHQ